MQPAVSQAVGLDSQVEAKPSPTPRVAVLIVTWNRRDLVQGVLDALARQDFPRGRLDVILVDNASTDGTLDALVRRDRPEVIVDNPTRLAHQPEFRPRPAREHLGNRLGFASFTIVRNLENLGGCGGFNTALTYVEHALAGDRGTRLIEATRAGEASPASSSNRPEFVWLVDDDVDLPPDALSHLVSAMRTDPAIGLVGSRTVDLRDRKTTIESTIYQERSTGVFADQPDAVHPRKADHEAWVATVGGVKGRRSFSGLRDVDIVSACSMLARWSSVERVGFWDHRYFIYCDDADWCLRFARAGHRVVLSLDAVVFHTPWHHKLTPARLYYAQRNLLWTIQKTFEPSRLRPIMRFRARALLRQSLEAGLCHRLSHAEVVRRGLDDASRGRGGSLDLPPPISALFADVAAVLRRGRTSRRSRPIQAAFVLHRPIALEWATGVRARLAEALGDSPSVRWLEFVRNDVTGAHELPTPPGLARHIYAPHLKSRLRRQLPLLRRRTDLLVVFDGACDLPLIRSPRWVLHVDSSRPLEGVLERGGLRSRLAFLGRWAATAWRAAAWVRRVRPAGPAGKYGGIQSAS